MTTRALGPGAGIAWLKQAVNLGRNNPKAVFGGAALAAAGRDGAGDRPERAGGAAAGGAEARARPARWRSMLLVMVPVLLLLAALMVGYLRLIDAVESGRDARASDVFAAFRDTGTSLRAIGFVVLLAIVQNVLIVALVGLLAKGVGSWYLQNMQASMPARRRHR